MWVVVIIFEMLGKNIKGYISSVLETMLHP